MRQCPKPVLYRTQKNWGNETMSRIRPLQYRFDKTESILLIQYVSGKLAANVPTEGADGSLSSRIMVGAVAGSPSLLSCDARQWLGPRW